jgi:UDP-N-acetylmuramate--alanine ligase
VDALVVTDVYPAREKPIRGVTGKLVSDAARASGHGKVTYLADRKAVAPRVLDMAKAGDMIITLGAGDIWKTGEEILRAL